MKINKLFLLSALPAALLFTSADMLAAPAQAKPVIICPQKPDPPPVIDGDPADWELVPAAITLDKSHIVWGAHQWKGEDDLSGTVRLSFDENYLYLLVEVIDEVIKTASDKGIFVSDHVELDFAPVYKDNAKVPVWATGGFWVLRPAQWKAPATRWRIWKRMLLPHSPPIWITAVLMWVPALLKMVMSWKLAYRGKFWA